MTPNPATATATHGHNKQPSVEEQRFSKGTDYQLTTLRTKEKERWGIETETKGKSNRVLSASGNRKSLKVWREFFNTLKESGMRT